MKTKIMSIFAMAILLLTISMVFAQTAENGRPETTGVQTTQVERPNNTDMVPEAREPVQAQEMNQERTMKSEVRGLENAMLRVRNNETKAHLEDVLSKIDDKRKQQLTKLEGMEVSKDEKTNKTIITGKGKAKFLGFIPTSKNYEYEVDNNGNVAKHNKMFDFLFKKEDPIDSTT